MYPDKRPELGNKGTHCIGPRALSRGNFVQELCPYDAIIDEDTAYIRMMTSGDRAYLRLEPRCASCSTKLRISRELKRLGIAVEPDQECCGHQACLESPWGGSKYCRRHLLANADNRPALNENFMTMLKKHFDQALMHQWGYSPSFERVLNLKAKIAAGELPGGRLICVDIEFSPSSGRVFEVGSCEYHSGKVIIDTSVKHDYKSSAELHDSTSLDATAPGRYLKMISHRAAKNVYGSNSKHPNGVSDVHEIVSKLREAQVTPESLVLVWHRNKTYLRLLRRLLEDGGYTGILPPGENCILMLPEVKRNLPLLKDKKKFPANLEIIFPLFFPGHELVGRNNKALIDATQLRLVSLAFEDTCRPIQGRNHDHLHYQHQQKLITEWISP
jgi:hypothetical protein